MVKPDLSVVAILEQPCSLFMGHLVSILIKLWRKVCLPTLLNGAELWTLNSSLLADLERCQVWFLKKVLHFPKFAHNLFVLKICDTRSIQFVITLCMKLPWFCHTNSRQLFCNCQLFAVALVPGLFFGGKPNETCCHSAVASKWLKTSVSLLCRTKYCGLNTN